MEFFDATGRSACYVTPEGRVYSWLGVPLGTVFSERMYSLDGDLLGWLRYGYLINKAGKCCLFVPGANSKVGASLPARRPKREKGAKLPFPELTTRESAPALPRILRQWGVNPFAEQTDSEWRARLGSAADSPTRRFMLLKGLVGAQP